MYLYIRTILVLVQYTGIHQKKSTKKVIAIKFFAYIKSTGGITRTLRFTILNILRKDLYSSTYLSIEYLTALYSIRIYFVFKHN